MTYPQLSADLRLRSGKPHELDDLQDIERRAAQRFESFPELGSLDGVSPKKTLRLALQRGDLWVVAREDLDRAVGFALTQPLGRALHLAEMDVLPTWGGRGIGTALLHHVLNEARLRGLPRVTLTTFRDVPWNAPFYARHGFRHLEPDDWTPELAHLVEEEDDAGLERSRRTVMACDLSTVDQPTV